ncbi:hypothetical protein EB73_06620 [Mycobacterium sp. SWH-M3]|nr:hypothetical protein EB73_06620 [Mycobacterium sp. SWH-M3]
MSDDDLGSNDGELRRWWARTIRVALATADISRIELHRMLVAQFGDLAPSQTSTYRLVSGEQLPRADTIVMIARLLNISPKELVPEDSRILTLTAAR